jgi:hypothetical protein
MKGSVAGMISLKFKVEKFKVGNTLKIGSSILEMGNDVK